MEKKTLLELLGGMTLLGLLIWLILWVVNRD